MWTSLFDSNHRISDGLKLKVGHCKTVVLCFLNHFCLDHELYNAIDDLAPEPTTKLERRLVSLIFMKGANISEGYYNVSEHLLNDRNI